MPRGKAEQAEVVIPKLREVEGELGRGKTVAEAVKKTGEDSQEIRRRGFTLTGPDGAGPGGLTC